MLCCGVERNYDIIFLYEIVGILGFLKWDKIRYRINNISMRIFVLYKCIIYIFFEKLFGFYFLINVFNDVLYIEYFVLIK